MNASDFDQRVQEHFDARRDPLDDPQVLAFLDAHPEQLPAFATLLGTLRQLPAAARRRVRWRAPLLLAGAAAIAFAVVWAWRPPRTVAPEATPTSRIFAAELQEIRPRLHAAVQFSLRQPLLADTTTTLEAYERRSHAR
jgi:hypothetical protein